MYDPRVYYRAHPEALERGIPPTVPPAAGDSKSSASSANCPTCGRGESRTAGKKSGIEEEDADPGDADERKDDRQDERQAKRFKAEDRKHAPPDRGRGRSRSKTPEGRSNSKMRMVHLFENEKKQWSFVAHAERFMAPELLFKTPSNDRRGKRKES